MTEKGRGLNANHHPSEATLLAYATGQLSEGFSLVVAAHMAWCPSCAEAAMAAETVGGVLLSQVSPAECSDTLLVRTLQALDRRPAATAPRHTVRAGGAALAELKLPQPLQGYLDALRGARWRRLGPGIDQICLISRTAGGGTVRMLRAKPGVKLPRHGHAGSELSLILAGAYDDEFGRFERGDVSDLDQEVKHEPRSDEREGCVCLIATDRPVRFEGLLARLFQPIIGF